MSRPPRRRIARAGRTRSWVRGQMNGHEQAYAAHLDTLQQKGHILAYFFEPCSWVLGPNVRFHPDFLVVMADGELQVHEVKANRKGRWFGEDDAKVKLKTFADRYWMFRLIVTWPADKEKSYWKQEEIG